MNTRIWIKDGALAAPLAGAEVEPGQARTKDEDGKPRPSDQEFRDSAGVPDREVAALIWVDSFGRAVPETVTLLLSSAQRPELEDFLGGAA